MSRDIPAGLQANLDDNVIYPFFAVELLFDGNPIRTWTGNGIITYEGNDFTGSGSLLSISSVEETSEISVRGANLSLSGIPSDFLALALGTPYQGRICKIYFGLTTRGNSVYSANDIEPPLVADFSLGYYQIEVPYPHTLTPIFTGYMDQMNISEEADTCSIELKVENKLIDLERARVSRFTSGYQKSIYPGDLGLDFVESLQDRPIAWGKKIEKADRVSAIKSLF
jgi:hypothetical protein